jgi:NNP family nitrate/nitrite transporter-like MFS transporter
MVWVLLGPLAPFLGEAPELSATQKGVLTAIPLLGGSFFRLVLGWMTERTGGRATGLIGLGVTLLPLFAGWQLASQLGHFLALGLLLGVAGASFAAALPLASGWYPPQHQGLAMGIAGAGNSGTLVATLFAPRLAQAFGWHTVFGLAMVPVAAVWVAFFSMAKDAPGVRAAKTWNDYAGVLKHADCWRFCFIYSITFGGFVGLASFLSVFFHDQYHLTKVQSGDFTTCVVVFGSFLRPVGGLLADRVGGYRILLGLLAGVSLCLFGVAMLPAVGIALMVLAGGMAMLGMGNGAVFQLVPQRFAARVGIMTGIVGAAGGFGGFLLPSLLGAGFALFAAVGLAGSALLWLSSRTWRNAWSADCLRRAGISLAGRAAPLQFPDSLPQSEA